MSQPFDLKKTLNLPRTDFPMQARLAQSEPRLLERWQRENLYQRLRQARRGAPLFVLHDGPPYANGELHPGTGLNKILKDFVVRSKSMAGFDSPFVPGWDCHGLPIEINVDKELGARKAQLSPLEIRQACRAYAAGFVESHRRTFLRLGCLGDWQNPYLTMSNDYEFVIADAFLTFLEKGYVYKGLKPVLWCWHDQTALAEAEIEYEMRASPSIWVRYPIVAEKLPAGFPAGGFAVIWTTTPWTLPASLALAFHTQLRYALVESAAGPSTPLGTSERYLVAEDLVERFAKDTGVRVDRQLGAWTGRELEGLKFQHPFLDRALPAVLADYVTLEQGTGIVHTAPGHGAEDFETGRQYELDIYCPVDAAGRFTEGLDDYRGQQIFEANPRIVELLRKHGMLVGDAGTIEHSYPHCWRCHQPLLFRATEQWFISLEHENLRRRAVEAVQKVKWIPAWGEERIRAMLETRPDWCISRQRVWGVPIPIFYCENCGEKFTDVPTLRTVVKWFQREGADAWYRHTAAELLPQGTRCENCGDTRFRPETDILDVWFDSGSSHLAVLGHRKDLPWPADLYLEGSDQYRGWFHSSLLVALGTKGASPYRAVVTPGWVLDADGRPMSKSLGNFVPAQEVAEKYGAEVFRLLAASVDYQADVRFGPKLLEQTAEAYRKIRNTFRFCLSNLYDFDPARDAVPAEKMEELDRYLMVCAAELVERSRAAYDAFEFHRVYHGVYNFCTVDLSAVYFDILKDRLYTFHPRSPARRSAQTVLYRLASALARLLAPILCYTTEEIWQHLPGAPVRAESVHLLLFPQREELEAGLSLDKIANWESLVLERDQVLKALEKARTQGTIRSSLEAKVIIGAAGDRADLLEEYKPDLSALFIVSQVEVKRRAVRDVLATPALPWKARTGGFPTRIDRKFMGTVPPEYQESLDIQVVRAEGKKCERCWNYSPQVGASPAYPTLCKRCLQVVEALAAGPDAS